MGLNQIQDQDLDRDPSHTLLGQIWTLTPRSQSLLREKQSPPQQQGSVLSLRKWAQMKSARNTTGITEQSISIWSIPASQSRWHTRRAIRRSTIRTSCVWPMKLPSPNMRLCWHKSSAAPNISLIHKTLWSRYAKRSTTFQRRSRRCGGVPELPIELSVPAYRGISIY